MGVTKWVTQACTIPAVLLLFYRARIALIAPVDG
jgi:hypothetical protein